MLGRIQRQLAALYDLEPTADVEDFLCDGELVRRTVGPGAEARGEVLLVLEEEGDVHVGLYLEPQVLEVLPTLLERSAPLGDAGFRALCLATEGVSHFLYLSFRAENEESVTQLELELQAEVDKYAAGLLAGNGVGAFRARSQALRERLFDSPRFIDDASSPEGERYRMAHRLAARYAAELESSFVAAGRMHELAVELRRFYRLGRREKLERLL